MAANERRLPLPRVSDDLIILAVRQGTLRSPALASSLADDEPIDGIRGAAEKLIAALEH